MVRFSLCFPRCASLAELGQTPQSVLFCSDWGDVPAEEASNHSSSSLLGESTA